MSSSRQTCTPKTYQDFLRATSPTPGEPESAMLPLFPRAQRLCRTNTVPTQEAKSLVSCIEAVTEGPASWLVPVQVKEEEEDEDMANEHLVMVSGWRA